VPVLLGGDSRVIVPSAANTGESYYMSEGSWKDFYNYIDDSGFENTGNICIKALAIHDPTLSSSSFMDDDHAILKENYPNPFTDQTTISYQLDSEASVSLVVYNTIGQVILQADEGVKQAGQHSFILNASKIKQSQFNEGLYFYSIEIDGQRVETRKMLKQ
jgi:hypothetical protein